MENVLRGEKSRRYFSTNRKLMLHAELVADDYAHIFFNVVDQAIEEAYHKVEAKRTSDNAIRKAA